MVTLLAVKNSLALAKAYLCYKALCIHQLGQFLSAELHFEIIY